MRKCPTIKPLLAALFCMQFCYANAQSSLTEKVSYALNNYYLNYQPEKVYVQTDKENYFPGEQIFFKAYITMNGKLSAVSKILYIELFDSSNVVAQKFMYAAPGATCSGNISIPAYMKNGAYTLAAYTAWMRNFDESVCFKKIINIQDNKDTGAIQTVDDLNLSFFPEGGNLIQGLTSEVVFKAEDNFFHPVQISGEVKDKYGRTVANINTLHDGMGSFMLHVPVGGTTYTASVKTAGGQTKTFDLPMPLAAGVVLHMKNNNDAGKKNILFRISRSILDKEKYADLLLCTQQANKFDLTDINFDISTAGNSFDTSIDCPSELPLDEYKEGIILVTLFNKKDGSVLAERMIYNYANEQSLSVPVAFDASSNTGTSCTVQMPAGFSNNISVLVKNADNLSQSGDDLATYLRLTSNLQFPVYNAAWYLADSGNLHERATDLLLVSNKWSAFEWNKILDNYKPNIIYDPEQSLSISGTVSITKKKEPELYRNAKVKFIVKDESDSSMDLITVPLDSTGRFVINDLSFHDSASIYIQNNSEKNNKISVHFDTRYTEQMHPLSYLQYGHSYNKAVTTNQLTTITQKTITEIKSVPEKKINKPIDTSGLTIKSVTVTAHTKTHTDSVMEHYTNGMFATRTNGRTYDLTNDPATQYSNMNVIEYIQAYIPGPIIKGNTSGSGFEVPIIYWRLNFSLFVPTNNSDPSRGESMKVKDQSAREMANSPSFFLNETQLNEGAGNYESAMITLLNIKMKDVALIRVFQPGTFAMVAGNAPSGAIAVYLKDGALINSSGQPSYFNKIKVAGYAKGGDINTIDVFTTHVKDPGTIYWQPDVKIDSATNSAQFIFSKNIYVKKYLITIQGIDDNGNILHKEIMYP